jgi:hypothetical protein
METRAMMGWLAGDQAKLFYTFCLEEMVPGDHLLGRIDRVLDLGENSIGVLRHSTAPSAGRRSIPN